MSRAKLELIKFEMHPRVVKMGEHLVLFGAIMSFSLNSSSGSAEQMFSSTTSLQVANIGGRIVAMRDHIVIYGRYSAIKVRSRPVTPLLKIRFLSTIHAAAGQIYPWRISHIFTMWNHPQTLGDYLAIYCTTGPIRRLWKRWWLWGAQKSNLPLQTPSVFLQSLHFYFNTNSEAAKLPTLFPAFFPSRCPAEWLSCFKPWVALLDTGWMGTGHWWG